MKKIAIDCRSLLWKHSGIARYLHNILLEIAKIDKDNDYFLLTPEALELPFEAKNMHQVVLSNNFLLYKFIQTPQFLKKYAIDVYWSPTQELPLKKVENCKYISTIHDIAFEHNYVTTSLNVKILHALGIYKRSAELADLIFTDSNYSKDDMVKVYNISPEKILVTYLGVEEKFKPIEKATARKHVEKLLSVTSRYIFYINTGKPKNLFSAFSQLLKAEWKNKDITLICLGKSVSPEEYIDTLAQEFGIETNVKKINTFVTDEDLMYLYSGAEFFVCPSYFEGFGLTPLESLKCETPILISNVAALPEIFQDAALYCDPYRIEDIKEKMNTLYDDKELQTEILKKKDKLIQLYQWNKIADVLQKKLSQ